MGRESRRGPRRGADLRYDLGLVFEEAVFGCEKEIEVTRHETCPECSGSRAEAGTSPVRCSECNGTGQVRKMQRSILGSFVSVTTCPSCQGEGEDNADNDGSDLPFAQPVLGAVRIDTRG